MEVRLPLEEVRAGLHTLIGPPDLMGRDFGQDPQRRPFHGTVGPPELRFRRMLPWYYRNSFLPEFQGHLEADGDRTFLHLRLTLTPFIKMFLAVWFLGATIPLLGGVVDLLAGNGTRSLALGLAFWLLGYVIVMGGFDIEASVAKRLLLRRLRELEQRRS